MNLGSTFTKSVLTLATGSMIAQVIPVVASPFLTRLYTPEAFGVLAVFMAMITSLSPMVCGKYEVAMVLPKSNRQGMHLLGIAIEAAFIVSLVFFVILIIAGDWVLAKLNTQGLDIWIYVAPLALLFTGITLAMNYFANRQLNYKLMAQVKIFQAFIVVIVNIFFGLLGYGAPGLLGGTVLGLLFANIYLVYSYRRQLSWGVFKWGRGKALLLQRYKDFPLYNASSGMLDGLAVAMPVFFLTNYFPDAIVGFYALLIRVGNAPLAFISAAVSQVNLKKVADLVNHDQSVQPYLLKISVVLMGVVLLPTLMLVFYSQELFALIFGEEWREAGLYMQILAPALAVRFVASTLSSTLGATQNNQLGMIWKVTAFIVTANVFSWYAPKGDIIVLFRAVMIMDIALYIFYYALIWRAAVKPRGKSA